VTFQELTQKLEANGLLLPEVNKDGEHVHRCRVCQTVDGHVSGCSVEERIRTAARS
jgi:hypothetical protein